MKNTFTTMDIVDGKYIATVFDSTNNQQIYKTEPRATQLQATLDVNNFLTSHNPAPTPTRTVIKNTTTIKNIPAVGSSAPRRCCGR